MTSDRAELYALLRRGKLFTANAKINLSIDVLGIKPENGYHLVRMIMQQIPLYDRLFFFIGPDAELLPLKKPIDDQISLSCNTRRLPLNEKNLVYKAARLIMDQCGIRDTVTVYIEKHIPSGGGLGGGSADGAAVLRGMNSIYALGMTPDELAALAAPLGSDVPFMVRGGACLAQGTGTELSRLPALKKGWLLLVNPNIFLSTERVYKTLDEMTLPADAHPDTERLIAALGTQDLKEFAANMKNVLEFPAFSLCPKIRELKEDLLARGALGAMMSGSGATVFGIFEEEDAARQLMTVYREQRFFSMVTSL